ncbi:MAG: HAMP domain-containing protein [Planctomycetes bacterium]|nr:HAMP domain-containing protein [Planctomycetota bacterium]MCP4771044.1 HAMP domain-containing protein [Planctomycetota bacterium]MCP4861762.1 HAMP domain-containing protein [Planctomycetota bacterium]
MRDPLHWLSIRYKLAFGFVGLCLTAFGIGGYFISQTAKDTLEAEILKRLEFQSQAYATDLHASLEMLTRRTEDFASDGYVRDHLARIVNEQDQETATLMRSELSRHLLVNKLPLEAAFMDLAVVDASGKIVVALLDGSSETARELAEWSKGQMESQSSNVFAGQTDSSPGLVIATPVYGLRSGKPIGHLLATVRAGIWISRAMQTDRLGRNRTVEDVRLCLIDNAGGCLLVPTTFLNYTGPAETTLPILEGRGLQVLAPGEEEQIEPNANDDGRVYSQQFPIGGSGWEAEVRIRASRALAPVSGLQSEFLIVGGLLALFSLLLLYFPMHFLARPLVMLRLAALRIREGDFSARVDVSTEDEMGDLGRAFNLMAEAVEHHTTELEGAANDLKERQEEVKSQRDRLDRVISTMRDGLVVLDHNSKVLLSNHAAGPLLELLQSPGASEDSSSSLSLVRRQCSREEAPSHDASQSCGVCLMDNGEGPQSCTLVLGKKVLEVHATPLPLGATGHTGRILVARDVTLRVARDESEIHQERLVVLGEVAATMAHELNNPLASISMFNQMMEAKLPEDSELLENVDVIRRNTQTCKSVISELLNYATTAAPESGLVDMHGTLEDVGRFLRPLAERRGVEFAWKLDAKAIDVRGDEVQLRQIFVNLVINAIQAVEGGGVVTLCSMEQGDTLLIDVCDTGCGIPKEQQAEVFRAFFTTKAHGEGTGLGLPTAQRIAESHGGGIELLESSASGTSFRVRLRTATETMV